jgi:hypothetical protein
MFTVGWHPRLFRFIRFADEEARLALASCVEVLTLVGMSDEKRPEADASSIE